MFHLQVFSTSWWFTPQTTLWSYRIPLALVGFALQSVPLKGSTVLSSSLVSSKMRRLDFHLYQPACQQMECQISLIRRPDQSSYVRNFKARRLVKLNNGKHSASKDTVSLTKKSKTRLMHALPNKIEHCIPEDVLCSMC